MSENRFRCRSCVPKTKGKVPKRVHKAEREKLKREHLNELFLDLANALGNVPSPSLIHIDDQLGFRFVKSVIFMYRSESAEQWEGLYSL